jgi:hypothetical protein
MKCSLGAQVLFTVVVCASVAITSFAQTGETYTLNVIGFQKVVVPPEPNLRLSSTPYQDTSDNIDTVIGAQLTGLDSYESSDDIIMFNPASQAYEYYFIGGGQDEPEVDGKWFVSLPEGARRVMTSEALIPPGRGMWFISRQPVSQTVVLAGDVVNVGSMTNHIGAGLQLISYPYSAPILLTNTTIISSGAYGDEDFNSSDNVYLWDVDRQSYVRFFVGGDGNWYSDDDPAVPLENVHLNPGQGFWYDHKSTGFDWVETKPYTL